MLIQDALAVESKLSFSICYHDQVSIIREFEFSAVKPVEQVRDKNDKNRGNHNPCDSRIFVQKISLSSFLVCMIRNRFLGMSFRSLLLTPDWWSFLNPPFIQTESKAISKTMDNTAAFCLTCLTSWP